MPVDRGAVVWLQHHPEDIPMARENLAYRDRGFDDSGVRSLWAAVCLGYCKDFKDAYLSKCYKRMKECHEFFTTDIFQFYVNELVSPEEIESKILSKPIEDIRKMWTKIDQKLNPQFLQRLL